MEWKSFGRPHELGGGGSLTEVALSILFWASKVRFMPVLGVKDKQLVLFGILKFV